MAGRNQYSHEPCSADFPADTPWRVAYEALWAQFGRVDTERGIAPSQYVSINSHSVVDEKRKSERLPEERASQMDLLSGADLKAALGDAPNIKKKRKTKAK